MAVLTLILQSKIVERKDNKKDVATEQRKSDVSRNATSNHKIPQSEYPVKNSISESAENDASEGKNSYSAKDVDETPEQRYYRYGWAVDNGLLSRREMADFFSKLKDSIDSDFKRTSDGNYIVEVGEEQGINNVVIVAGNIYTMPSYERIYRIDKFTETEIEKIRNKIYEREKRQSNYEMRDVGTVFGEEFVETYDRNDVPTFRKFSRNSTRAKRGISRTNNKHYRFEQDGEGDARENTTPDSTEQKINFSLQDTAPADVDALMKENAQYKEAIEDLKAQFELTDGHRVSHEAVRKIARGILRTYKSSYDVETEIRKNCR